MKSINIIGCGPTAKEWDGLGDSLGCNDCEIYGNPVQNLLVIDWPLKLGDRFHTIKESKAVFWTQLSAWSKYKEDIKMIAIRRWQGQLPQQPIVALSNTSPFVAVGLAHSWGYQEIILWGVDMLRDKPYNREEISNFKELVSCLVKEGVKVYLGCKGSALEFIPVK